MTEAIAEVGQILIEALENGGKILLCGNGGSAADSQHIAAELVGRFKRQRNALASIALTTDSSILTSIGNDYGFDAIFARQVEGLGQSGDVLIGITTSGGSPNIVKAVEKAKSMSIKTIALVGPKASPLDEIADQTLHVPGNETARVQEGHITAGHIWCDMVEAHFSNR